VGSAIVCRNDDGGDGNRGLPMTVPEKSNLMLCKCINMLMALLGGMTTEQNNGVDRQMQCVFSFSITTNNRAWQIVMPQTDESHARSVHSTVLCMGSNLHNALHLNTIRCKAAPEY
jgi:hypothetical protein